MPRLIKRRTMVTKAQQRAINENWSIFQLKGIIEKTRTVRYFSPGISSRAVKIPVGVFREEV